MNELNYIFYGFTDGFSFIYLFKAECLTKRSELDWCGGEHATPKHGNLVFENVKQQKNARWVTF